MPLKRNATQFDGVGVDENKDIVIGLDFGTSWTKVVLQDPTVRVAFAVPFKDKGHQNNIYLVPTKLRLTTDGNCQLAGYKERGGSGLKMALMKIPKKPVRLRTSPPVETNALALTSMYIALILQHVRLWFLINLRDEYWNNRIRWYLNIGIPTPNYDDKNIKNAFLQAAYAGWRLSIQENPIAIHDANAVVQETGYEDFDPGLHRGFINVVPEVAAEVAGYARSPLREPGLHMIVDVGANTMDVATFRLETPEGEFEYWFLYAEVSEHACFGLHNCRLEYTKKFLDNWLNDLRRIDSLRAEIPHGNEDYSPPDVDLSDVDCEFVEKAKGPVSRVAAISYTKRDPNASEWKTGIPLFICGGGSNLDLFNNEVIERAESKLKGYKISKFRTRTLPKPEHLVAPKLHPHDYHRLAVAYGLSFFYDDIGRIVPPSSIGDIKKIERIKVVDYLSKDMV